MSLIFFHTFSICSVIHSVHVLMLYTAGKTETFSLKVIFNYWKYIAHVSKCSVPDHIFLFKKLGTLIIMIRPNQNCPWFVWGLDKMLPIPRFLHSILCCSVIQFSENPKQWYPKIHLLLCSQSLTLREDFDDQALDTMPAKIRISRT